FSFIEPEYKPRKTPVLTTTTNNKEVAPKSGKEAIKGNAWWVLPSSSSSAKISKTKSTVPAPTYNIDVVWKGHPSTMSEVKRSSIIAGVAKMKQLMRERPSTFQAIEEWCDKSEEWTGKMKEWSLERNVLASPSMDNNVDICFMFIDHAAMMQNKLNEWKNFVA